MTIIKHTVKSLYTQSQHAFTARPRPSTDIFSQFINPCKKVNIIGAPFAKGQPLLGVDRGPNAIRNGGLIKRLQKDDWIINDTGDLDFTLITHNTQNDSSEMKKKLSDRVLNPYLVSHANQMVYQATRKSHESNDFTLALGGDHSIAIGTLAGALKARTNTGIIWVDAHGDINTPITSDSGNIHGMVISFLMNYHNVRNDVPYFSWLNDVPIFDPRNNLVYVGLRDVDAGEKRIMKEFGIKAFTMYELDKFGIGKVMEMAMDHILNRIQRPIHLSFDIDSLDPTFAPSTGTRVAGGLTYREAYYICESIAETGQLCSMDLVEVNPLLNETGANATVDMANGLIASALGNTIM